MTNKRTLTTAVVVTAAFFGMVGASYGANHPAHQVKFGTEITRATQGMRPYCADRGQVATISVEYKLDGSAEVLGACH